MGKDSHLLARQAVKSQAKTTEHGCRDGLRLEPATLAHQNDSLAHQKDGLDVRSNPRFEDGIKPQNHRSQNQTSACPTSTIPWPTNWGSFHWRDPLLLFSPSIVFFLR